MINPRQRTNRIFIGVTIFSYLVLIQSCSSTNRILPSSYSELNENESKEYTDYRIKLVDGTKYTASRISTDDSTLTIHAIHNSDDTKGNVLISRMLPYSIPLGEIESIELRKSSKLYLVIAITLIFFFIAFALMDQYFEIDVPAD